MNVTSIDDIRILACDIKWPPLTLRIVDVVRPYCSKGTWLLSAYAIDLMHNEIHLKAFGSDVFRINEILSTSASNIFEIANYKIDHNHNTKYSTCILPFFLNLVGSSLIMKSASTQLPLFKKLPYFIRFSRNLSM